MAEERFIDDDKDRKYRIRINEDGEEELEVIPDDEEEEQDETVTGLEVPEFEEDDEEVANLSPEQLYLVMKKREEERAAAESKAQELVDRARALLDDGQEEYALTTLDSAQKEYEKLGDIYPLKLRLVTKNFTDISGLEEVAELTENLIAYSAAEDKSAVCSALIPVAERELAAQEEKNAAVSAENEGKKAERRVRFAAAYKKSLIRFICAVVPFIVLLCVGIVFSTRMFDPDGIYIVLTIVFFALAAVALILMIAFARPLARDARRVKLNERDTSTAIGRSLIEGEERAQALSALCAALKGATKENATKNDETKDD